MTLGFRRLLTLCALVALGFLASLSVSSSLALFSATGAGKAQTFAAGTVVLTGKSAPGDRCLLGGTTGAPSACTYTISYSGSLSAWVWLDVVASGSTASGLQIVGSSPIQTFTIGSHQIVAGEAVEGGFQETITVSCPASSAPSVSVSPCETSPSECEGTGTQESPSDQQSQQNSDGESGDQTACSGLTVTLRAYAVQAANNTNASDNGPVSWS